MTLITFTVQGAAAAQGSKRHLGNGVMVESSKRVKPWRSDVRDAAWLAMSGVAPDDPRDEGITLLNFQPLTGPVKVAVEFAYRRPAGHFLSDGVSLSAAGRRASHPMRGDIDKLCRALFDAMTGIVYVDDRQVVDVHATRVYGPRDEAKVQVLAVQVLEAVA